MYICIFLHFWFKTAQNVSIIRHIYVKNLILEVNMYSVFQVQVLRRDWTNRFSEITVIPDGRTDFFEVASKKISLFRSGTCVLVTASTGWLF